MKNCLRLLLLLSLSLSLSLSPAFAQQSDDYDYYEANRVMIRNGAQAILTCNGLFTSGRTLEQVFRQELALLDEPVGTPSGGDYLIDLERRAVAIGGGESGPVMRAAFREQAELLAEGNVDLIILEMLASDVPNSIAAIAVPVGTPRSFLNEKDRTFWRAQA